MDPPLYTEETDIALQENRSPWEVSGRGHTSCAGEDIWKLAACPRGAKSVGRLGFELGLDWMAYTLLTRHERSLTLPM